MRGEEPRTTHFLQSFDFLGHDVQAVGIDHHWLLRRANERENFLRARLPQTGTDRPDVDRLLEQIGGRFNRLHHHFGRRSGSDDLVNFLRHEKLHQPAARPQRA